MEPYSPAWSLPKEPPDGHRFRELSDVDPAPLWNAMQHVARGKAIQEPDLGSFFHTTILNHEDFPSALAARVVSILATPRLPNKVIRDAIDEAINDDLRIVSSAVLDIVAAYERDPACQDHATPFLFFKGFQALLAYRLAHWLWHQGRTSLALLVQNKVSADLGVDIHPAARIGQGIMMDHATGVVIGETAVVDDDVSILHHVTLGGTGKESGDRHPKVRHGVLLGAGCKVIGNIVVGTGAMVGAGSVVLSDVPPNVTVAGVPARVIGRAKSSKPGLTMDHRLP